ncbi:hypothetical protein Clacol_006151 [Clathrus columnatus]|uniref:Hydrophobin n=1 Tax=Clathrus columnatus TaxID=1419009 RepID=A0AAV5AEH9_9AGAM|nr:hypothetical protein Clacol_006151 [Clathrus columnatus]
MFKLLLPIALALSVAAAPQTTVVAQCNTGAVMCCNSMQSSDNPVIGSLLDMLGLDAGNLTANNGQVGVGCTAVGIE